VRREIDGINAILALPLRARVAAANF